MSVTRKQNPLYQGIPPEWAVAWGEDEYGSFADFAVGKVVQRMRWIAPGRFLMGSPEDEAGRFDDEGPQHEVILTEGFWLGDTPVTQGLWEGVTRSNPSHFKGSEHPVEHVSWDDCQAFCKALGNNVPGLEPRLPSEAEWEYACRAGTTTATWVGNLEIKNDRAPQLESIAWYRGNSSEGQSSSSSRRQTHPVAEKEINPWGLYDMLGNVYEWCEDAYAPYASGASRNPVNTQGAGRVIRGGSWGSDARLVRAAYRYWSAPGHRYNFVGVRLARGQAPEERGAEPPTGGQE